MANPSIGALTRLSCWHWAVATVLFGCAALAASPADEKKKPETSREMFRALGVEDSYFDRFADRSPLGAADTESLLRVLFRLRNFPPADLERWTLGSDQLDAAIEQPDKFRGAIFRLRGRVTEVAPIGPPKDAAQRYELARYFRCRLQLDSPLQLADVYTENVPAEWRNGATPGAPAGAFGAFLKLAKTTDDRPVLVFAAPRLAWYPDNLLGRLGMDFGLFDAVQNQKPITAEDREAFYQMLAAVGRAKPGQLLRQAEANLPNLPENRRWTDRQGSELYSVVPLFNRPDSLRGQLVELLGAARRVEKIHVADPDIVARFGITEYFQISLFTEDSQGNPLTFCVRDLPEGMPYGNLPRYGETVRIAGFFFKTWSYAVPKMADPTLTAGDRKTHHQLSPLLIGRSPVWYPAPQPAESTLSNAVFVVLFVLAMLAIWFMAWRNSRRDRKRLAAMETPPKFDSGIELDQMKKRD